MKVLLGGSSEEVVFTDQQLCQTGVRAVGAASSAAGRRAARTLQLKYNFAVLDKSDANKML